MAAREQEILKEQNAKLESSVSIYELEAEKRMKEYDDDYLKKKESQINCRETVMQQISNYQVEYLKKPQFEHENAELETYLKKFTEEVDYIESQMTKYDAIIEYSIKDLEKPLKKVEKIKKKNIKIEKEVLDLRTKLENNKKTMIEYIESNLALRNHLDGEENRRNMLEKLVRDLEKKLAIEG